MDKHSLEKLEYQKILDLLQQHCHTYLGKNLAQNLLPASKKEIVETSLTETFEAVNLSMRKGNAPLFGIEDITFYLKQLDASICLSTKALLCIASVFRLSRELKNYFYEDEHFDLTDFPILSSYFSLLYTNTHIEEKITNSILEEDIIADDASSTLASLRRNRRKLETSIKDTLNQMIHSPTYAKYMMEPIVTIRNDRYVIPVKEEYRGNVKGFIHDVSSSGSTLYIEPTSIFEMNNKINHFKLEEAIEIQNILQNLTNLLAPHTTALQNNLTMIGKLDFAFAKSLFAKALEANKPILSEEKELAFYEARHPFIAKEDVVPITVSIGKDFNSLMITGPNTGGKTATLKTVGLLTLMACSGLFIPATAQSKIYVFDQVFADIGDEQSIQESLSTFSAHMLNVNHILKSCTSNSLILLDELGSGTDPLEGANLAIAILEAFHQNGCLTIATTHYQEIKNYALVTDGFENASCEFDIEHLKPTYRLLIGIPGKSNAFAISQKLGLPSSILDRAKSLLKQEDISIEELLKNIYDDKQVIEREKEEIVKNKNQIVMLRKSLEQQSLQLQEKQNEQKEKAQKEARDILLQAKEEANRIIKELETLSAKEDLKRANQLRQNLNDDLKHISFQNDTDTKSGSIEPLSFSVGQVVQLKQFHAPATILAIPANGKNIQVQIGAIKTTVSPMDILQILPKETPSQELATKKTNTSFKSKHITTEINVMGQNIEEACFVIDKYLDDSALAKLQTIRIVHGKGTGKLREGIHAFLKKHPHVKSFRLGTFGEGEMGVTVVELK